jgi:hypothetical protein
MMTGNMRERWDGLHWRWWALAGGIGMVVLTFVLVTLASTVLDQSIAALLTLVLLAELLILSMMGSGMLSATSRRMSRGGLARETATLDVDYAARARSTFEKERDRDARDRRTIRYAIMLLPVLVACVYLLAR